MSEHYTEICRQCGAVISQCRCMSPNKVTRYGLCDACAGKVEPPKEVAIWHRLTTYEDLEEAGRNADPAMLAEVYARSKAMSDRILARIRSERTASLVTPNQLKYIRMLLKQRGFQEPPRLDQWTALNASKLIGNLQDKRYKPVYAPDGRIVGWDPVKKANDTTERVAERYMEALPTPRQRAWERRKEKDDFAEKNIPPEHLKLWRKLKNQFKGTPDQRAEQFMEYLEEHPGESAEVLQQQADKDVARLVREQETQRREQVKVERECEKNQTRYEDAWYKEQERATREKAKLKQLKEKADGACQLCPTCNVPQNEDNWVPFAASASLRVAARYEFQEALQHICNDKAAIVVLVTSGTGMDVRIYPTDPLAEETLGKLNAYILGIFHEAGIEVYGDCKDAGGAVLSYMTQSAWKHIKDALMGASWDGKPFRLLLNPQPSSYPDAERHHIVIDARGDVMTAIEKVLLAIKNLGDVGHSTSVDIDGKAVAGVDGDGSDRIEEIIVDDMPLDKQAAARVAARYKEKKKITNQKGEKTTVYLYSDKQVEKRNADKAKRLEALRKSIGNLRTKVKRDLRSSDPERQLTALAVALIDHTYERVGNEESAKERKHYGVTGWRKRHISFGKGHATIKYTGKSGVQQSKKVTDKAILTALRNAYEACGDDEGAIFDHDDIGRVTAEKINAYLEPFNVSAKDLRGFHANREMQERLSATRSKGGKLPEDKKAREKQLKAEFKEALEAAAEAVGHEPSTLRSQYLVPGLEEAFLKDGTVPSKMKIANSFTYDEYSYQR